MESSFFSLLAIFLFGLGLIIGSFLNVLVLRFHTGRSLSGRSQCFSCGRRLAPFELVPVISYIFLRGRCRTCRSSISPQYPLVELSTGLLFLGSFLLFDFSLLSASLLLALLSYFVLVSALVAIVAYDVCHKIIPDSFVAVFILSALALHLFRGEPLAPFVLGGIALAIPFTGLWYFSRGRYMGLGDGKLAFGIGLLLGPLYGLTAIVLAFRAGAIIGLLLTTLHKMPIPLSSDRERLTMKSEMPFAPFLVLGTFYVLLAHFSLFELPLF